MDIRTENLTILFVDIAGFTATTSRQSRAENAHLLHTFERTLLPLIKRFKGNVVKSIGDALLLTFRSPTDAMLCSMALQDAMHAHNLNAPDDQKIHIRVAANLGEVRVTKKDIFGEPVNVASRIEGVAPADEIYLSEAVYMAMNKAEVPAQEVGFKELAGISQPVRVYSIPRFATHRLVPQNVLSPDQGSELLFPYGGMHQRAASQSTASVLQHSPALTRIGLPIIALLVIAGLGWGGYLLLGSPADTESHTVAVTAETAKSEAPATAATAAKTPDLTSKIAPNNIESNKPAEPVASVVADKPASTEPAPAKTKPATKSDSPANTATVASKSATTAPASAITQTVPAPVNKTAPKVWNVIAAKAAYRAGQLTKLEYKQVIQKLEAVYEARVRELKLAYRAGKISKPEYEDQVRLAKQAYNGR